jgi:hypothetical protein
MDADDLRWLLQTIETPEMAERFVLAQHRHGRISAHVNAEIGLERPWISQAAIQAKPAATDQSSEWQQRHFSIPDNSIYMETQSSAHSERNGIGEPTKVPASAGKEHVTVLDWSPARLSHSASLDDKYGLIIYAVLFANLA